jgi:hypothetical protein
VARRAPSTAVVGRMPFAPLEVPAAGKEFGYVDVYSSVAISATMPVGVICAADPVRGEELRPPRAPRHHQAAMSRSS